jgi:hypothetical protein
MDNNADRGFAGALLVAEQDNVRAIVEAAKAFDCREASRCWLRGRLLRP